MYSQRAVEMGIKKRCRIIARVADQRVPAVDELTSQILAANLTELSETCTRDHEIDS